MSESSEDKTKRKLLKVISELNPIYATSIFLTDYQDKENILSLYSKVRTPVARHHKESTIIFYLRTCTPRKSMIDNVPAFTIGGLIRLPQIQLLSVDKLDNEWIEEYVRDKLGITVNVSRQAFNIEKWTSTVKNQGLLRLEKVLGTTNFRRYNVVNKKQLNQKEEGCLF